MPCYSQLVELRLGCHELLGSGVYKRHTCRGTFGVVASTTGYMVDAKCKTEQLTMSLSCSPSVTMMGMSLCHRSLCSPIASHVVMSQLGQFLHALGQFLHALGQFLHALRAIPCNFLLCPFASLCTCCSASNLVAWYIYMHDKCSAFTCFFGMLYQHCQNNATGQVYSF